MRDVDCGTRKEPVGVCFLCGVFGGDFLNRVV